MTNALLEIQKEFLLFSLFFLPPSVSPGRLHGDHKPAALLLPGSVLLDVSGGGSALQDGGLGLQHQL